MEQKKTQMTPAAHQRLKDELNHLEGEGRQRIIDAIATARAHGDLSENAEYHAAREQQGMQEARVRQLKQMLEGAEIIEADDEATVKPGKVVTIKWEGDNESETYLIGLREEKGGDHDVLTPESPIGKSLVGKSVGDTAVAQVPAGDRKIEILEVRSPR
jgi:transcription elongation factor GreA